MPTELLCGERIIVEQSARLRELGERALIVTGRYSSRANGSLDDATEALERQGIEWELFDAVEENPSIATVRKGGEAARDFGAEFILGIGGGSPMDAAKAVALLACNDFSDDELFGDHSYHTILPLAMIPTTVGTGSEVTPYAIITDIAGGTKRNIRSSRSFPRYAFCDQRYLETLSRGPMVHTVVDALSHALEGFLSIRASAMTDLYAREALQIHGRALQLLLRDGKISEGFRQELLFASTLAGMVIAQTGTTALHALGYPLTVFRDIPHGRANGLLMASWLMTLERGRNRRVHVALELMGLSDTRELSRLLSDLLMPTERLSEDEVKRFAAQAQDSGKGVTTEPVITLRDLESILRESLAL